MRERDVYYSKLGTRAWSNNNITEKFNIDIPTNMAVSLSLGSTV